MVCPVPITICQLSWLSVGVSNEPEKVFAPATKLKVKFESVVGPDGKSVPSV